VCSSDLEEPSEDDDMAASIGFGKMQTNQSALAALRRLGLLDTFLGVPDWGLRTPDEVTAYLSGRENGIRVIGNVITFGGEHADRETLEVLCMLDLLDKPLDGWRKPPVLTPGICEALLRAITAHDGQRDKAGQPFILHPLQVMFSLKSEDEQIAALLHDVAEDTQYTLEDIKAWGFGHLIETLDCLTRRKGEKYGQYIARVRQNRLAVSVKIADMKHNLSRIGPLPEKERTLADRYNKWLPVLEKCMAEYEKEEHGDGE
jgi:hypothetical protein